MKHRNTIITLYIVGIVILIGTYMLPYFKSMPRILYELFFAYGIFSCTGIILALIPVRRNRLIKWFGIVCVYISFILFFKQEFQTNKIILGISFFVLTLFFITLYWSFDNVSVVLNLEKQALMYINQYEEENNKYNEEIEEYNKLRKTWESLDEDLGIEKSWKSKFKDFFGISKYISFIQDIKRKYPSINYKDIIGLPAIYPSSTELDDIIKKINSYIIWLSNNQEKIRNRSIYIIESMEQMIGQLEKVYDASGENIPKHVKQALGTDYMEKFRSDAKIIKEKYNKNKKIEAMIKKRL